MLDHGRGPYGSVPVGGASMIDLDEISPDDQVIIQDQLGNVASGTVHQGELNGCPAWLITAFGVAIFVARQGKTGHWVPVKGIRVVGHTPLLLRGLL